MFNATSMTFSGMPFGLLLALLVVAATSQSGFCQIEGEEIADSPSTMLQFQTIHSDGEKILLVIQQNRYEPKTVEQTFTVMVPVKKEDGTTEFVPETRTRTVTVNVNVGKRIFKTANESMVFENLAGEKITRSNILENFPRSGKRVLVLAADQTIPHEFKALLKEDVVIMRMAPSD